VSLSLDWNGGMSFRNGQDSPAIALDSGTPGVTSPPEALAYAVMACMAMDIVHIIQKGRHRLDALRVRFHGARAEAQPRRFLTMQLHFELTGDVPDAAVARAIELSRETYCSVWNTLKDDVELATSFTVLPPEKS
jgi:putative redox protein